MSTEATEPAEPSSASYWEWRDLAPLLSLICLVAFFSFTTRNFFSVGTVVQVLEQGSVLAIVSAGLTFVLLCAEIDLAVGMLALWTACCCGVLYEMPFAAGSGAKQQASYWAIAIVILAPLASTLLLGLLSGALTVWSRLPSFIITLAMMNIASGMARWLTRSERFEVPKILQSLGNESVQHVLRQWTDGRIDLGGFRVPCCAVLAGVVLFVSHLVLQHTRFGRYVYMVGGNREAARLAGIRTGLITIACLGISGVLAGVAGLLNAGRLYSVSLDQNADLLLDAVACVVLGGTSLFGGEGGIGRTFVGVLTFTILKVGIDKITWIDNFARIFLIGVVLMIALVINGLLARGRSS